ncbi:MAG: hypothetical protein ACE5WD_02940 [Candidatus Aminicenantia bacterium]
MNKNNKTVRIFTMPLQFPCGPQAACCGPIGQSEEEIQKLKESIEKELGVRVEVKNVMRGEDMRDYRQISELFRSFGPMSLPIIAIEDEVVSMGNPTPEEAVSTLQEKMNELGIQ